MAWCWNDFADILGERLGPPTAAVRKISALGLPSPQTVGIIHRLALGMCRSFVYYSVFESFEDNAA